MSKWNAPDMPTEGGPIDYVFIRWISHHDGTEYVSLGENRHGEFWMIHAVDEREWTEGRGTFDTIGTVTGWQAIQFPSAQIEKERTDARA